MRWGRTMRSVGLAVLVAVGLGGVQTAQACNQTRLATDMLCCLQKTCSPDRPGSKTVLGAVQRAPTSQTLWNLRRGFKECQQTDEYNNFLSCERADKKGPYNTGRRLLGLPPA